MASGNMPSEIAGGSQRAISLMGKEKLQAEKTYELKDEEEQSMLEVSLLNECSVLVVSVDGLTEEGKYTLWLEQVPVAESSPENMFFRPGMDGKIPPNRPKR